MLPNTTDFYDSGTSLCKASTCAGEQSFEHPEQTSHPAIVEFDGHSHTGEVTSSSCTLQDGKR